MSRLGASRGFVLSLEFILMVTILLIGMLAGCVLIRDELIEFVLNKQRSPTR